MKGNNRFLWAGLLLVTLAASGCLETRSPNNKAVQQGIALVSLDGHGDTPRPNTAMQIPSMYKETPQSPGNPSRKLAAGFDNKSTRTGRLPDAKLQSVDYRQFGAAGKTNLPEPPPLVQPSDTEPPAAPAANTKTPKLPLAPPSAKNGISPSPGIKQETAFLGQPHSANSHEKRPHLLPGIAGHVARLGGPQHQAPKADEKNMAPARVKVILGDPRRPARQPGTPSTTRQDNRDRAEEMPKRVPEPPPMSPTQPDKYPPPTLQQRQPLSETPTQLKEKDTSAAPVSEIDKFGPNLSHGAELPPPQHDQPKASQQPQNRLPIAVMPKQQTRGLSPGIPAGNVTTMFRLAQQLFATMPGYTIQLRRREKIGRRSLPEEVLHMKFRQQPWSVYLKWIGNVHKGQEAVYVHGHYNNQVHVRLSKSVFPLFRGGKVLHLSPHSSTLRAQSRHPITSAGVGNLIARFGQLVQAGAHGDYRQGKLTYLDMVKRPEFPKPLEAVLQVIPARAENQLPGGGRRFWFFDTRSRLPVLIITQDNSQQEVEYYCYENLRVHNSLSNRDFDPAVLFR